MDRDVAKKLLGRLITEAQVVAPAMAEPDGTYDHDPDEGLDRRRAERWQIEANDVLRDLAHNSNGLAFSDLYSLHVKTISRIHSVSVKIHRTMEKLVTALELIDSQAAHVGAESSKGKIPKVGPSPIAPVLTALPALTSTPNWKDHPVVIAAAAVVATSGFWILLDKEVILPTQTAKLNNQINDRSSHNLSLTEENVKLSNAKLERDQKIEQLEAKVSELEHKNSDLELSNLFSLGNPYPVNFRQVKIGDTIASQATIYPENVIQKDDDGYWTIDNHDKIFSRVVYYYEKTLPKNPVTHIAFFVDYKANLDNSSIQQKLVEAFGPPKQWRRKGYFSWPTHSKVTVYNLDKLGFVLMQEGSTPSSWPNE